MDVPDVVHLSGVKDMQDVQGVQGVKGVIHFEGIKSKELKITLNVISVNDAKWNKFIFNKGLLLGPKYSYK